MVVAKTAVIPDRGGTFGEVSIARDRPAGSDLAGDVELISPDLARVEMANVLRKKGFLEGHLTRDEFVAAVRTLDDFGVELVVQDADGIERVAHASADHMVNVYDATFVELALQRGLPLLTGDARSSRAVADVVRVEVLRGVA